MNRTRIRRRSAAIRVTAGAVLSLLLGGALAAQSATLSIGTAAGEGGESVTCTIECSATQPIFGVSLGIETSDPSVGTVAAVDPGADLLPLDGGFGPPFFLVQLQPGGSPGFTLAFVTDFVLDLFSPPELLASGLPHEVAVVTYVINAGAPAESSLAFTDTLGNPPVTTLVNVVDVGPPLPPEYLPVEFAPTTVDGSLVRAPSGEAVMSITALGPAPRGGTGTVGVIVQHAESFLAAWLGIAHDPAGLSVVSVEPGAGLVGPPELFLPLIEPSGFSVGVFADNAPPYVDLPPASIDTEIVAVTYAIAFDAAAIEPLTFSDTVGAGVFQEVVIAPDDSSFLAATLTQVDGALETIEVPIFIRGDANGDGNPTLADAIVTAQYLFQGGSVPCAQGSDFDDNGQVTVSDVFSLLAYLFVANPPPPGPFPTCGIDPDLSLLPCDTPLPTCP